MMYRLTNPWGDGRDAWVIDDMCRHRPCLRVGEDKGTFQTGRGYVRYHKKPVLVCLRNHISGCPYPIPEPKCCDNPGVKKYKGRQPHERQRCLSCGIWLKGEYLRIIQNK